MWPQQLLLTITSVCVDFMYRIQLFPPIPYDCESFHSRIIITNLTTLRCCTIFTVHYAHSHIFHVRYLPIYIYVREMKNLAINFHDPPPPPSSSYSSERFAEKNISIYYLQSIFYIQVCYHHHHHTSRAIKRS